MNRIAISPRFMFLNATVLATLVVVPFNADAAVHTFMNTAPISIPDPGASVGGTIGDASPYPSSISVAGVPGTVDKITIGLLNLSHEKPDDIAVMLVGPTAAVHLWEDAGGDDDVTGIDVLFDDSAVGPIPGAGPLTAGSFQVSVFGPLETFGPPAPSPPPFGTNLNLSDFNGIDPNGTWELYVLDDQSQNKGSIAGGWVLNISTPGVADIPEPSMFAIWGLLGLWGLGRSWRKNATS